MRINGSPFITSVPVSVWTADGCTVCALVPALVAPSVEILEHWTMKGPQDCPVLFAATSTLRPLQTVHL